MPFGTELSKKFETPKRGVEKNTVLLYFARYHYLVRKQNLPKKQIFPNPLICIDVYQGVRNVSFSGYSAHVMNWRSPMPSIVLSSI